MYIKNYPTAPKSNKITGNDLREGWRKRKYSFEGEIEAQSEAGNPPLPRNFY